MLIRMSIVFIFLFSLPVFASAAEPVNSMGVQPIYQENQQKAILIEGWLSSSI